MGCCGNGATPVAAATVGVRFADRLPGALAPPPSLAGSLGTCSADTRFFPKPSGHLVDTQSQLPFQASVRPTSLAQARALRSVQRHKGPSVQFWEGVVRPGLCQHRLSCEDWGQCLACGARVVAEESAPSSLLIMGTLSCDPAAQLATATLAQRVAEGHIPETGLRKSCRMATLENGVCWPGGHGWYTFCPLTGAPGMFWSLAGGGSCRKVPVFL